MDIKNNNGDACVIEVNDNPSLESGEDACYPHIYEQIVSYLFAARSSLTEKLLLRAEPVSMACGGRGYA